MKVAEYGVMTECGQKKETIELDDVACGLIRSGVMAYQEGSLRNHLQEELLSNCGVALTADEQNFPGEKQAISQLP